MSDERLGPKAKKILLLLEAGIVLSLTRRPDVYFSILKKAAKEWKKINERNLRDAIRRLYKSKLIDYKENKDKTVTIILSEKGKKRILKYDLDKIQIKKPFSPLSYPLVCQMLSNAKVYPIGMAF